MSEEQTFRTEDNTFLLLSRGTVASAARNYVEPMKRHAKRQKDFEAARLGVFATPVCPSLILIAQLGFIGPQQVLSVPTSEIPLFPPLTKGDERGI